MLGHAWLYRIAPRIIDTHKPYHDNNVGTLSAGINKTLETVIGSGVRGEGKASIIIDGYNISSCLFLLTGCLFYSIDLGCPDNPI